MTAALRRFDTRQRAILMSIDTLYKVIPPTGAILAKTTLLPRDPGYSRLKGIVEPILQEARSHAEMEHVAVLYQGKPASMFVDEVGALIPLEFNRRATEIYHAAWLSRYPTADPDTLDRIYGTVVLFTRNVWF